MKSILLRGAQKTIECGAYMCGFMVDKEDCNLKGNPNITQGYIDQIRDDRLSRMLANDVDSLLLSYRRVRRRCCLLTMSRLKFWWRWVKTLRIFYWKSWVVSCCWYFEGLCEILNESIVNVSDLMFHVFDFLFHSEQLLTEHILIITEIVCIFLNSTEKGFVIGHWFIDCFLILVEILFIYLP